MHWIVFSYRILFPSGCPMMSVSHFCTRTSSPNWYREAGQPQEFLPCERCRREPSQLRQLIPHIRHRQNIARVARIDLNFTAQAANIDPDEVDVAVVFRPPDFL